MADDDNQANDESAARERRTCPSCGAVIRGGVILGPGTGYAGPCGCRVAPAWITGAALDLE